MLRDLIIALSVANIAFVEIWSKIIFMEKKDTYLLGNLPTTSSLLALLINELILALVFWLGMKLVRRLKFQWLLKTVKVFFVLIVLYFLEVVAERFINFKVSGQQVGVIILVIILIIALVRRKTIKSAIQVTLILAPFVLVIFVQAIWGIVTNINKPGNMNPGLQRPPIITNQISAPRVVWIIFDEMDQQISFVKRPPQVKLPEFDRFRQQALFATNAKEPGPHTLVSIPALTTGRLVSDAVQAGPDQLEITFKGTSQSEIWGNQSSVFSQAKDLGIKTAVVGWYHPYSRVYKNQVTFCNWGPLKYDSVSDEDTLVANLVKQLGCFSPWLDAQNHIRNYKELLDSTLQTATNPEFGLVFVHFPIPHAPYIYDSAGKRFTYYNDNKGYFDNLNLTDMVLGKIRKNMMAQQLWDKTTVLISADHHCRTANEFDGKIDHRVPFIIKLAGQKEAVTYNSAFNTVLSKDLILAILGKEITTPENLVDWLDNRRTGR